MLGLTQLGVIHTAIGLFALGAGFVSLARHKEISLRTLAGQLYIWATVATCLTGFGIFQHGGFGAPHALGIITLAVLAVAMLAERRQLFGRASRVIETVAYSLTFFFHFIPGITETASRFPQGAPLVTGAEDPVLPKVFGVLFLVYLVGVFLQVRRLKRSGAAAQSAVA
jgi:uncharacterized membrane protein